MIPGRNFLLFCGPFFILWYGWFSSNFMWVIWASFYLPFVNACHLFLNFFYNFTVIWLVSTSFSIDLLQLSLFICFFQNRPWFRTLVNDILYVPVCVCVFFFSFYLFWWDFFSFFFFFFLYFFFFSGVIAATLLILSFGCYQDNVLVWDLPQLGDQRIRSVSSHLSFLFVLIF